MIETGPDIVAGGLWIAGFFLFFGAACGLLRLLRGPYLVDRVVALDFLSFVAVAFICILAIVFKQERYLDVAIILALLAFLATVAFARYTERRKEQGTGLEELDD
jgi:multicomponent Na+:H+ antiporter subunit F